MVLDTAATKRVARSVLVGLLVALAVAGCSSTRGELRPSVNSDGPPPLESYLEQARLAGVDPAQIELLEEAVSADSINFSEARSAIDAVMQCFTQAGVEHTYHQVTRSDGLVIPGYTIVSDPLTGEIPLVAQKCIDAHSRYVEMAYQLQPSSVALEEAHFESKKPEILECLRENGVVVDDDATHDEIVRLAGELATGLSWEQIQRLAVESDDGVVIFDESEMPLGPDCLRPVHE